VKGSTRARVVDREAEMQGERICVSNIRITPDLKQEIGVA
jgi:hypothetical protein